MQIEYIKNHTKNILGFGVVSFHVLYVVLGMPLRLGCEVGKWRKLWYNGRVVYI